MLQHIEIAEPKVSIYNFHGMPKSGKLDTPERKIQTTSVLHAMRQDTNPKILVGDFNLRPETESLRAFEESMKNLVIEGGFSATRSRFYDHVEAQPFADYAFITRDIIVKKFEVLPDEVSDHLPLLLELQ